MKLAVSAFLVAFLALSGAAQADPDAVRQTIRAQLDAFKAGDAKAAYALAAPSLKRMFPTPERFITMVRRGYAPVYYGRSPVFLRSHAIDDGRFAQEVGIVDQSGKAWTALYTLARQPDGSWRITGCYLREAAGQNV
ncbi:DUF4864 domain-containing protein [Acuticoccus mangrovi]|uniref:DUF4864 domain-containing protein n=1 Tax=Acuticoccus mangrovi TaxID=2796142 RepID=A0A934IMI1_9HYPH|nr:DUF4864 domain-containing protein [Acuticoccus mangrovi]MBJ3775103.1 DUF4864 domain-containing protein [Acuticoccus mangrovi]